MTSPSGNSATPAPPETSESDRVVGAAVGGGILGASLAGPPGFLLGLLAGVILGAVVNEEKRKGREG